MLRDEIVISHLVVDLFKLFVGRDVVFGHFQMLNRLVVFALLLEDIGDAA
jgi:hypothetical protein